MLKYMEHYFTAILDGAEDLPVILAGMSGKNRRIVSVAGKHQGFLYIRIYRDAEQFVSFPSDLLTDEAPLLPLDIPLAEGQICKAGYYNNTGDTEDAHIVIGYEETG